MLTDLRLYNDNRMHVVIPAYKEERFIGEVP
jgi:hypothetical protein